MAYEPTEWNCGDALTADKLNKMERGIGDMNGEYTPNEWSCGDTITAEKLNHMEQGIANGGGGECDFSTAEVTIVTGNEMVYYITMASVVDDESLGKFLEAVHGISGDSTIYITMPLYGGQALVYLDELYTITTSGDATYDADASMIIVTGDCTITIS